MSGETSTCALSTEIAKSQFAHGVNLNVYIPQSVVLISSLKPKFHFWEKFMGKKSRGRIDNFEKLDILVNTIGITGFQ
ncbi:MAG: hypothetical protein WB791_07040 [Waddliaceae bacterium]